jgi:hypothetical protein
MVALVYAWGTSMAAEVKVDPALLDRAHGVCSDLRAECARDEHDVEGTTTDAGRGLAGWGTQKALENLLWFWRDDITRLGAYLDKFGNALQQTGAAYRESDQASADLFDIRGR